LPKSEKISINYIERPFQRVKQKAAEAGLKSVAEYDDIALRTPEGTQTGPGTARCRRATTEEGYSMGKEAIIFFDKLGFGWVVDSTILKDVKLSILQEEDLPSRSLMKIIENMLTEKCIM